MNIRLALVRADCVEGARTERYVRKLIYGGRRGRPVRLSDVENASFRRRLRWLFRKHGVAVAE